MKKLIISSTVLASLSVLFTGCSSSTTTQAPASTSTQQTAKQGAQPAAENGNAVVLKVGYLAAADSPVDKAVHQLAADLEKKTNGKVKLEIYNNAQLGGESAMMNNMKIGALDIEISGDAAFAMAIPEYSGVSSLYLFKSEDKMYNALHGPIGDELNQAFQSKINCQVLDWWDRGPRELTANKEIKTPDDLKNLKIRTPEIPNILDSWRALGANPTPMSFDQVFNALSQKVIDAQENPLDLIYTSKFYEAQKYVMLTDHMIEPWIFLINNDSLKKLSPDQQKIFKDAIVQAGKAEGEMVKTDDENYIKLLKEKGVTVVNVDKEAFAKIIDQAHVDDKYKDKWKPGFLDKIRESQK